jgi:hypothetical protein
LFFWYFYGLIDQNPKHINIVGAVKAFVIGELRKNLKIGHEKFSIDTDKGNESIYQKEHLLHRDILEICLCFITFECRIHAS